MSACCRLIWLSLSCALAGLAWVQPLKAELRADQVAILTNRTMPDSRAVAEHYAERRGMAADHIIAVDLPAEETISRDQYDALVSAVRQGLQQRKLADTIRVLVTTYGMPLRVAARPLAAQEEGWRADALERQRFARGYMEVIRREARTIASVAESAKRPSDVLPEEDTRPDDANSVNSVLVAVQTALTQAADRIKREDRGPTRDRLVKTLAGLRQAFGGMAASLEAARTEGGPAGATHTKVAQLERELDSGRAMAQLLMTAPTDVRRRRAYKLIEQLFGLQGVLQLAAAELEGLDGTRGDASLDSELSLLWWDRDLYRINGRTPNPIHYIGHTEGASEPSAISPTLPVLMVARLDAPTADLAVRLVDLAIEAEEHGLVGKAYVDARGLKADPHDLYGTYDQSLRDLAQLIRSTKAYEVALEDTPRRFSQEGEAPDVALYAGWYRLRDYEDAFAFKPGAIGYHIASAEAVSLHDPTEPGWCKNALERGITATLGSTGEPYLDAFPKPDEFFGLLLTGRYSLVEAYYLTSKYVSWRMLLVGDPLYNPWRGKAVLSEKDARLRPLPPSDRPFPDPAAAIATARQTREAALAHVDSLLTELERRSQKR